MENNFKWSNTFTSRSYVGSKWVSYRIYTQRIEKGNNLFYVQKLCKIVIKSRFLGKERYSYTSIGYACDRR